MELRSCRAYTVARVGRNRPVRIADGDFLASGHDLLEKARSFLIRFSVNYDDKAFLRAYPLYIHFETISIDRLIVGSSLCFGSRWKGKSCHRSSFQPLELSYQTHPERDGPQFEWPPLLRVASSPHVPRLLCQSPIDVRTTTLGEQSVLSSSSREYPTVNCQSSKISRPQDWPSDAANRKASPLSVSPNRLFRPVSRPVAPVASRSPGSSVFGGSGPCRNEAGRTIAAALGWREPTPSSAGVLWLAAESTVVLSLTKSLCWFLFWNWIGGSPALSSETRWLVSREDGGVCEGGETDFSEDNVDKEVGVTWAPIDRPAGVIRLCW